MRRAWFHRRSETQSPDSSGSRRPFLSGPLSETMSNIFGVAGPNNVEVLDHPTRMHGNLIAVGDVSEDDSSDYSGVEITPRGARTAEITPRGAITSEITPRGARTPLARTPGGSSKARVLARQMESGDYGQERSEVLISGSGYETTPRSTIGALGQGMSQTPRFANTSFHSGQQRSVRFGKELTPIRQRREWARQNSRTNPASRVEVSVSTTIGGSVHSVDMAAPPRYSVFPKEIPLDDRREYELELIQRFDRLEINKRVGEFWYIIDSTWMNRWINFVLGKGDPPGRISNLNLFEREDSAARRESVLVTHAVLARARGGALAARPDLTVRAGLQKVRDYRAIHALVWYLLRGMYDADDAPEICRWTSDIYTAEVTAQRKLRLEGDSHTKAAYELHRFLTRVNEDAADRAEEARRQAAGEEASRTPRRSRFRRKGQGVESSDAW